MEYAVYQSSLLHLGYIVNAMVILKSTFLSQNGLKTLKYVYNS